MGKKEQQSPQDDQPDRRGGAMPTHGTSSPLPSPPRAVSCQSLLARSHPPSFTRPRAGHSLRAPLCQNAFPHRGPCLPAHSPHTCLPQKRARSILDSCSCLPSVSSGASWSTRRRTDPNVGTREPKCGQGPAVRSRAWGQPSRPSHR